MKRLVFSLLICFTVVMASNHLYAQATLSIQGLLQKSFGASLEDDTYPLTFKLYTTETGGTALWTETQNVDVTGGVYSALLGSVTPLDIPFNTTYFLSVTVNGTELSPRAKLSASPYAFALVGAENVFPSAGNVGVGTLAPTEKLEVNGNIKLSGEIQSNNSHIKGLNTIQGATNLLFKGDPTGDDMAINAAGNVSIGSSSSAGSKLQISNGTDATLANGTGFLQIGPASGGTHNIALDDNEIQARNGSGATAVLHLNFDGGDVQIVKFGAAGNVGIGRVPITNRLEVDGQASKAAAGDWIANSDARLKKNLTPLQPDLMLQKMLALQGITYEWNDDKTGSIRPEGIHYGFTAQNIAEVFPTLVEEDNLGYLQTAYGTFDAMTVESLRALYEISNQLNKQIEYQQGLLQNIGAQIEVMKSEVASLKGASAELEALKTQPTNGKE